MYVEHQHQILFGTPGAKRMNSVKRYGPVCTYIGTGDYIPGMVEEADGPYIIYYDYQLLQSKLQEAEARVKQLESELNPQIDSPIQKLGASLAELLDADHWNNIEPYLYAIKAQTESAEAKLQEAEARVKAMEVFEASYRKHRTELTQQLESAEAKLRRALNINAGFYSEKLDTMCMTGEIDQPLMECIIRDLMTLQDIKDDHGR